MFLLKTIQKSVEKTVLEYTHVLAEKYGIPEDDLVEMWTEVSKMRIKTASNQSKRMSPWLRFCKEERVKMKSSHPELSFGEISKRIGEKWSAMSKDDRQAYITALSPATEGTTATTNVVVTTTTKKTTSSKKKKEKESTTTEDNPSVVDSSLWTKENLDKMKIDELRELCSNVQLSKSGKKSDLVDRLLKSIQYSSTGGGGGGWSKVPVSQEEDDASVTSNFDYDYASDS